MPPRQEARPRDHATEPYLSAWVASSPGVCAGQSTRRLPAGSPRRTSTQALGLRTGGSFLAGTFAEPPDPPAEAPKLGHLAARREPEVKPWARTPWALTLSHFQLCRVQFLFPPVTESGRTGEGC